jgi:DNA repair protein RecN (Recombination protein N)
MLQNLRIKNFALIEDLEMECNSGLNVLTGETGAGKSILIDALNILLGDKAGPGFIRVGAEKAILEGIFAPKPSIIAWLNEKEFLDPSESDNGKSEYPAGELTITREISKTGSRFRINSILANQASINELKQLLIHVHAQHDARTLLSAQSQLDILDGLAEPNHQAILSQLENLYAQKASLKKELEQMQMSEEERVRKLEFAKFQLEELETANINQIDEDAQLEKKQTMLANIAQLDLAANSAYYALIGGEVNTESSETSLNSGAIDNLQIALSSLEKALKFDADLEPISDILNNALALLEEAQIKLRHYKDNLDTDPEALQEMEARIAQLATIKRKYGPTLEEAANKLHALQKETEQLDNIASETDKLESQLKSINKESNDLATTANKNRQALAKKLIAQMKNELSDLGMENCKFEVLFEKLTDIGPNGFDRIEFMISPNPGQPLLPLAKIASGGELSRIMLALKSIVTGLNDPPTVIFDEIDTGLSGRIVQAVRDKLAKLAQLRQILCITHQPIIAAAANNHLFIEKLQSKENTNVTIKILVGQERVKALAAMAGGDGNETVALDFAQALINQQSHV